MEWDEIYAHVAPHILSAILIDPVLETVYSFGIDMPPEHVEFHILRRSATRRAELRRVVFTHSRHRFLPFLDGASLHTQSNTGRHS
jgi:hypothetical protein